MGFIFFPEDSGSWQVASKLNSLLTNENERLQQLTEDLKQKYSHMTSEVQIIAICIVIGAAVYCNKPLFEPWLQLKCCLLVRKFRLGDVNILCVSPGFSSLITF